MKKEAVRSAKELRREIASLVREYHDVQFGGRPFTPGLDLTHYAGRVFDAARIAQQADEKTRAIDRRFF